MPCTVYREHGAQGLGISRVNLGKAGRQRRVRSTEYLDGTRSKTPKSQFQRCTVGERELVGALGGDQGSPPSAPTLCCTPFF